MDKEAIMAKAGFMGFEGATPGEVIAYLHRAGLNELDSIMALHRALAMSVTEGKEALLQSGLWRLSRERFEEAAVEAEKLVLEDQKRA